MWRRKSVPAWLGEELVPVVHGRAPRATRRASRRPPPPARPNSSDASPTNTPKRALPSRRWTIGGRPVSVLSNARRTPRRSPIGAGIDAFVGIPTPLLRITKTHPSVVLGLAAPNFLRSRFRDVSCNSKFFGWFSGVDPSYVGDGRDAGGGDFCLYQDHAL